MKILVISFFALICAGPCLAAGPLACLQDFTVETGSRAVAVETIHRLPNGPVITVFLPLPVTGADGRVHDLNAMGFDEAFPQQVSISDGTLKTAFISLDLRPESRLSQCARELAEQVRQRASTEKKQLSLLTKFIAEYLDIVPDNFRFEWDPQQEIPLPPEFAQVAKSEPGHPPLMTQLQHPIVPLESFLAAGRGLCLQKVLLTSLIMRELGLPHQIRAGATDVSGHAWIELPDGRHLDPTWQILQKTTTQGALPGWFRFDSSYLYRNQHFPFSVN